MTLESMGENWADKFEKHPVRTLFTGFVGLLAVCFVLTLIANAFGIANIYWEAEQAKITAAPRVTKQIYGTDNIISKVAFFHERCEGVKEKLKIFENNFARYQRERENAKLITDPLERQAAVAALGSAQADVTAALNGAQASAAEYNAAAANPTVNPFRTIFHQHNLPERIELPAGESEAAKFVATFTCG